MSRLLLVAWLLLCGSAWAGDELRVGIFVGNDAGAPSQQRLLFATADARKMRDLFVSYGDLAGRDALLVLDESRRNVESAFVTAGARIASAKAEGRPTTLLFYYSGHGDDENLNLGTTTVSHDELRGWIEATGADVRIAMLDACQSGSVVRNKGGVRGPSRAFAVDTRSTRGTAFLTSSAASELSQESEDLGGGFFTYYLHSALLGAADRDGDGVVSLSEANAYVHDETSFATRHAPGTQTPSFDFDLTGSGEVALTRLVAAEATLVFDGTLDGTYAVWDATRKRYVAEIDGSEPARIGVPAGIYYVQHRMPGWVEEADYPVADGDEVTVTAMDFVTLAYEDTEARGALKRQVRKATMPRLTLQAVIGGRGFGANSVYARQYIPTHVVGGLQLRWMPYRKGPYWAADFLTGSGAGPLSFQIVGTQQVNVHSWSAGATAGYATGPGLVRAGGGGKVELVHFSRDFVDGSLERQSTTSAAFGPTGWIGIHYRRVSVDFQASLLLFPVRWDGNPAHFFGEGVWVFGYRF